MHSLQGESHTTFSSVQPREGKYCKSREGYGCDWGKLTSRFILDLLDKEMEEAVHRPKKEPIPLEGEGKGQGAPWGPTQEGAKAGRGWIEMASSHSRCLGVTWKFWIEGWTQGLRRLEVNRSWISAIFTWKQSIPPTRQADLFPCQPIAEAWNRLSVRWRRVSVMKIEQEKGHSKGQMAEVDKQGSSWMHCKCGHCYTQIQTQTLRQTDTHTHMGPLEF